MTDHNTMSANVFGNDKRIMLHARNKVSPRDGDTTCPPVSTTSGGRTATVTGGFDFQHARVSY